MTVTENAMVVPKITTIIAFSLFTGVLFGRLPGTAYGNVECRRPVSVLGIREALGLVCPSFADEPVEKELARADICFEKE